jgi:hypothetical protein
MSELTVKKIYMNRLGSLPSAEEHRTSLSYILLVLEIPATKNLNCSISCTMTMEMKTMNLADV